MLRSDLFTRPWSCHRPKVEGFEPQITHRITKVGTGKTAWRAEVLVDACPMATSHHETKYAAESKAASMMEAYTEAHYVSR